ncbi:transcription elongation factor S-II [Xylaria digitata]|nr:transcription elongation factor S-II [Xylaria digitata]
MPAPTRTELLAAAKGFCDSFAQKRSVDEILSHFSSRGTNGEAGERIDIVVYEHGLPRLAPLLGREFRGLEGAREYFETVERYLSYEDMRFVEYVADAGAGERGKVVARGKARFTWTETNQSWDETFVYVLRFDARAKLTRYEVWADSGAAYLAARGELASAET